MTITVGGLNYTQIAACESASADTGVGGAWSGDSPVVDPATFLEGSNAMSFVVKSTSGIRYCTFTLTSSFDLSGTKHVRFALVSTLGGNMAVKASGGMMFYATDGTNTGYWNLDGRDTYKGGWKYQVVDVSQAVDSGTKPTSMNAITAMGVAFQLDSSGKNVASVWIDNLSIGDGLTIYGDDAGGYMDFETLYAADSATTGGYFCLNKVGGVYFSTGAFQIGDSASTNGCKFQAKNQTVVFEDRGSDINSSLFDFDIVDNGTGTTEFILGELSGSSGINGCTIRLEDESQTAKYTIDGSTDTDISDFKMYGSTISGASAIGLPTSGTNKEVIGCNFQKCGTITVSTCQFESNFIISPTEVGVLISSTSHGVKDNNFINCIAAMQITAAGTYACNGNLFSGGDGVTYYDVENTVNATTTDSYAESNQDTDEQVGNGTITAAGQSFTGDGNVLSRARLWLKSFGTLTGNAVCKIYLATGTDPSQTPTGSALATSNNVLASSVGATYEAVDFEFEDEFTLVNSTEYFIVLEYNLDASNYLVWGSDTSSPPSGSNYAEYTGSWTADSSADGCFYIYTGGIVKLALSNDANPAYDNNSGTPPGATIMPQSINLTVRGVKSDYETDAYVRVTIIALSGGYEVAGTVLMLEVANQTDEINSGYYKATETYVYVSSQPVKIVARYKGYKEFVTTYTLNGSDMDITAVWQRNPTVNLP